jgi:ribosomal-protein-alanine N-acetyltransferase
LNKHGYVFQSVEFSLRCPQKDDIDIIAAHCNDLIIHEALNTPYPYTNEMAEAYVNDTHAKWEEGTTYNFGIEIDGEIGGMVSIMQINNDHLRAEVGYWLGQPHRGKGLMSRVVNAVVHLGFEKLGLEKIFARTYPDNEISAKVLMRAGLEREGQLKKHAIVNGVRKDYIHWGIVSPYLD